VALTVCTAVVAVTDLVSVEIALTVTEDRYLPDAGVAVYTAVDGVIVLVSVETAEIAQ